MGWFDGNPTSLWQHPPQAAATRYVDVIGGQQAVRDKARSHAESGDLRFAAELLKHAVFADPGDAAAREASPPSTSASVTDRRTPPGAVSTFLAPSNCARASTSRARRHRREHGRCAHHRAALRHPGHPGGRPPRCRRVAGHRLAFHRHTDSTIRLALSSGALIQTANPRTKAAADLTLALSKAQLLGVLAGRGLDGIQHTGDLPALAKLMTPLDTPTRLSLSSRRERQRPARSDYMYIPPLTG